MGFRPVWPRCQLWINRRRIHNQKIHRSPAAAKWEGNERQRERWESSCQRFWLVGFPSSSGKFLVLPSPSSKIVRSCCHVRLFIQRTAINSIVLSSIQMHQNIFYNECVVTRVTIELRRGKDILTKDALRWNARHPYPIQEYHLL